MTSSKYWTEAAIIKALNKLWPTGAYVIIPQVRNGTGYQRSKTRTADAVVASVWPSNGLWLTGVEVKLTRGDLRKELSDPTKSEGIGKYCERWYIAGPTQLWGETELTMAPDTWGVIGCTANATEIIRPAVKRETQPVDMLFVCSVLRAAAKLIPEAVDCDKRRQELDAARAAGKAESQTKIMELEYSIRQFETASGVSLTNSWELGDIGQAVALVRSAGYQRIPGFVRQMQKLAQQFNEEAEAAIQRMQTAERSDR